jgi:general secretion pathway protein I
MPKQLCNCHRGFSLLEMLIALAIIAITLAAAGRMASAATTTVSRYQQHSLALWVAQNRLAWHQLRQTDTSLGSREGESLQGAQRFHWHETIQVTPRADFRRIDIRVYHTNDRQFALATLTGFVPVIP